MDVLEQRREPRRAAPSPFLVTWDDPALERVSWTRDEAAAPEPLTPMSGALLTCAIEGGFNASWAAYEVPVQTWYRRINTYVYFGESVPVSVAPEQLDAQYQRAQHKLSAAVARLGDLWETDLLPEIKEHLTFWETFDLFGAALPALRAHLDETLIRYTRLFELHFVLLWPSFLAMSSFDDLYHDLFGDEDAAGAYRLLQGFDNKVLETDRALWRLSKDVLAVPAVRTIFARKAPPDVVPALAQLPEGQAFLTCLQAFLAEYGQRCTDSNCFELGSPHWWIDDPTPVITHLQDYITRPDHHPEVERAAMAATRERLIAERRGRLQGYPQPIVAEFERLLQAAQRATVLSEEHYYWIDGRGMYQTRRVLVEWGRRLATAGVIEHPDDVFFLTEDELRETARLLPAGDRRRLVAARQAEMAYFRTIEPPPTLGTPPSTPPDTPLHRAMGKFFGPPPQPVTERDVLRGAAGSSGVVRGPARVLRSLAEAGKLRTGDVLVTTMTQPPWTPLFATAAALVTDVGGVLCHGAVMAREYGIPAVVGTGDATARIQDGQVLEVDGAAGVVRILSSP
jgi:pyruvate,water dikinase